MIYFDDNIHLFNVDINFDKIQAQMELRNNLHWQVTLSKTLRVVSITASNFDFVLIKV